MDYEKLSKVELIRILENIRSPRFGHGEPDRPNYLSLLEALLLERFELQAQIQHLKDSLSRADESLTANFELFDSAPVGYIVLDASGSILRTNSLACAMLRRDRKSLAGLSFAHMLTEDTRFSFRQHFAECRRSETQVKTIVVELLIDEFTFPVIVAGCYSDIYRGILLSRCQLP